MTASFRQYQKAWARGILPLCLCAFLGVVLFLGMSSRPAGAQSNDILNRLKQMENDINTLNRAVYKGEKPSVPPVDPNATSDLEVRIGQIEADLRNLTGKVEQQSYDAQQMQQKLEALTQDTQMRLDAIEGQLRAAQSAPPPTSADPETATGTPDTPNPVPVDGGEAVSSDHAAGPTDAATLYEQGFSEIKKEDYAAAEKSFAAFMKQYPNHALAPNAIYWLGETHYARKSYDKAARVFAESYQKFPKGPKAADNLLKLGMSLAGKGEKDNACIALGQLKKEYPNGPAPVLARGDQEMTTLGCK